MPTTFTRRQLLSQAGAAAAGLAAGNLLVAAPQPVPAAEKPSPDRPFRFGLNTSTLRGQKLSLADEVDIAAKAGYDAIEPWMNEIRSFVEQGGKLPELKKRIDDAGLTVESAIGFANWIVDDDAQRAQGLEAAKQDMDLVRQIGGRRIAAPPVGATNQTDLDLLKAAKRYRDLLELGETMGVTPQLEVWGFSKSLSRLGEVALVTVESGRADACILPDVYHIYKGGSDFGGFRMLNGRQIHVFHMNDYPAEPPRETITDAHRVYPGDGLAPFDQLIPTLYEIGFRGVFSLELFNRDYWAQDALTVAKTGLEKMQRIVEQHLPS